jgi:hypothetical protein
MIRILAFLFVLLVPTTAWSQSSVILYCYNGGTPNVTVPCSSTYPVPTSGSGGGGGAITAAINAYAVGALQDGADVTEGTRGDAAYAGSGSASVVSILKGIYASVTGAIPAQSNTTTNIGNTGTLVNVTPTDCSLTISSGGTAQNIISAAATVHGFTIANIDTGHNAEPIWISFTTTAAASTAGSYPLSAPTATTFAGLSSYTTPAGFGSNHAVSVVAATSGHIISCTQW